MFHPGFKAEPFWWEAWRPTADGSVEPPGRIDVAIVGGGYAGLSAALELARHGTGVVVLEAAEFGAGASTRNGGAVSGGVNIGKGLSGSAGQSAALARALLGDAAESYTLLETIIAREAIPCCYVRTGRFVGAYTPRHYDDLVRKAEVLNRDAQSEATMLPRARQHEEIASAYYYGGMLVGRAGQLHPALYSYARAPRPARCGGRRTGSRSPRPRARYSPARSSSPPTATPGG